jgi:hypothetical protein
LPAIESSQVFDDAEQATGLRRRRDPPPEPGARSRPIDDRNFRADHEGNAEWVREVERLKLIHMPDFDDLIYDFRTMAERVNAR